MRVTVMFIDGEVLESESEAANLAKDDTFQQEGEGFNLRVWDPQNGGLVRVLGSLHALKAIFFVREWDGRTDEERVFYANPDQPLRAAGQT